MAPYPDSEILGKLILLQSTLHVIRDEVSLARFVHRGLRSLPGVDKMGICLGDAFYSDIDPTVFDREDGRAFFDSLAKGGGAAASADVLLRNFQLHPTIEAIKIATVFELYGVLFLQIDDTERFGICRPDLENTLNVVALTVENTRQNELLVQNQELLEKTVAQRTRELNDSERRYRSLFEKSNDGVILYDLAGQIIDTNEAAQNILGYPDSGLKALQVLELAPPSELPQAKRALREVAERGSFTFESKFIRHDGTVAEVEISASIIDPELELVQGLVRDITDRKRAERRLKESEEKFRRIFQDSVVPLFQSTPAGRFTAVNKAFARMLGYASPEELISGISDIATQYYAAPEDRGRYERMLKKRGTVEHFEFEALRKDGSRVWVSNSTRAVFDDRGRIARYEGIVEDISLRKAAEAEKETLQGQLAQARKMEAIGTLAGGIAHDFNNILTAIIGYTELGLENAAKAPGVEENLTAVLSAAMRARDLVGQILTFARQSEMTPKPVQVARIAEEAVRFLRSTLPASIEIRSRIDSTALVMADAGQVHQLFLNLCTNAAQAMEEEGGVLEIQVRNAEWNPDDAPGYLQLPPGRYLQIVVSDTGPGIPEEQRNAIFEPYFTTKKPGEGTGLGLAVVHGIVKSYGGDITVKSEAGKGSGFVIYLPAVDGDRDEDKTPAAHKTPTGNERILFVDDELPIVKMSVQLLSGLGYEVTATTDSLKAFQMFQENPHAFDLVITDMTMPQMNGDRLVGKMLRIRPDVPILLCTGYSKKINEQSAKQLGIHALVHKPVVKSALAEAIRTALDESAKTRSRAAAAVNEPEPR